MLFELETEESEKERVAELERVKASVREEERIRANKEIIKTELELKLQFLKEHSNTPEELELAKMVLGIN